MIEINGLWVGDSLGLMEKLTIKSFIDNGHQFNLYAYSDKLKNNVPHGTLLLDASRIVPKEKVFCYKGNGDCRAGSYGGFSDLFRYELLYKIGGWYVDMDVTCFNNFSVFDDKEYVIRPHHRTEVVGNIIKVPKNCEWMDICRKEAWNSIDEYNNDWHKPIEILRKNFHKCNLEKYVVDKKFFGTDGGDNLNIATVFYEYMFYPNKNDFKLRFYDELLEEKMYTISFYKDVEIFKYAIHWMNEASANGWYRKKIDWNDPKPKSIYSKLLRKFKLHSCRK